MHIADLHGQRSLNDREPLGVAEVKVRRHFAAWGDVELSERPLPAGLLAGYEERDGVVLNGVVDPPARRGPGLGHGWRTSRSSLGQPLQRRRDRASQIPGRASRLRALATSRFQYPGLSVAPSNAPGHARTCRDCRCPRITILRRPRIELLLRSARYRWHSKNRTAPAPTRCRCGTLHPFGAVESRIGWVFTALLPARETADSSLAAGRPRCCSCIRPGGTARTATRRRRQWRVLSAFAGGECVPSGQLILLGVAGTPV